VREECRLHAPLTLEIRARAREKNAVILAHSYTTPDVLYGIADFRGDSLGLSEAARDTRADVIVFCGVRFMAETAKVLSPEKTVLLPAPDAGCSLSESIGADQVRRLRRSTRARRSSATSTPMRRSRPSAMRASPRRTRSMS